jgi:Ca2+-binding EF-hand superfamily protein
MEELWGTLTQRLRSTRIFLAARRIHDRSERARRVARRLPMEHVVLSRSYSMKIAPTATQSFSPISSLLASRRAARQPTANPAATDSGLIPAVQGGPLQTPSAPLNLKGFYDAWGSANAQYDMTKDGVVDGKDLATFLGQSGSAPTPTVTPDDVMKAWGQNSGAADINSDGIVDGADLAMALGNVQPANDSQSLVDGVQKAWGSSNETYDLNKDGTVDGADLGIALSGAPAAQPAPAPTPTSDTLATKIVDSVFAARDIDQDTTLSVDEVPTVAAKLASKADSDHDGAVGKDELKTMLAKELASMQARRPDVDLGTIADRWLNAFLGKADPKVVSARNAYSNSQSLATMFAVNAKA